MRKKRIKLVTSLLAFEFMVGKDPGTHISSTKKIFVHARRAQNRAVAAIVRLERLERLKKMFSKYDLKESHGIKNITNEIR